MDPAILDTDILSEVLKQRNSLVRQRASRYLQLHAQFAISAVTRFEIVRGYKEANATTQLVRFANLCGNSLIMALTDPIFDRAADLWVVAFETLVAKVERMPPRPVRTTCKALSRSNGTAG